MSRTICIFSYLFMSEIRLDYRNRGKLQEALHLTYGKLYMTNIDSLGDVFVELSDNGEDTLAYVEFKNDHEIIKPFLLKALKKDCDTLNKPLYISVIHRNPVICYYLVPLNEAARKLPDLSKPRFMTERHYVWFLHQLRNKKCSKEQLEKFCNELPPVMPPLPNYAPGMKEFFNI